MQALRFYRFGDLSELKIENIPTPSPAENEVLVKVTASGINPSDIKNVLGKFPYTTLPRTPGRDFSGVVIEGPTQLMGKSVWGTGRDLGFFRNGTHAEYVTIPENAVALKPDNLSFAQAAICGVPYITAWDALERCNVKAQTNLLIIGAGAVSQAAIGLAAWRGANILVAARNPQQAEALRAKNIAVVSLSETESLADSVKQYFPSGAEVILDTTGFWLAQCVEALATPWGRIAVIAAPADGQTTLPILNLYRKGGNIIGINSLLYSLADCAKMLDKIGEGFSSGELEIPAAPREIKLDNAIEAYKKVNAGGVAKMVLTA